jgi:hypothetical protein
MRKTLHAFEFTVHNKHKLALKKRERERERDMIKKNS